MRSTDTGDKKYVQRERFFVQDKKWYFNTREGYQFGPFNSCHDAQSTLERFLKPKIMWKDKMTVKRCNPANAHNPGTSG